jgi:Fe-S-cluster-containing hydrogenase component 2
MIIVENLLACTGCLICEMVCSFHHICSYSRSQSSIKVDKSIFNKVKESRITISYKKERWDPVCDLCDGEEFPLCIRFCPENVFKFERRNA